MSETTTVEELEEEYENLSRAAEHSSRGWTVALNRVREDLINAKESQIEELSRLSDKKRVRGEIEELQAESDNE
jgi:hypothetical protein